MAKAIGGWLRHRWLCPAAD